jgi:hypothetical protein
MLDGIDKFHRVAGIGQEGGMSFPAGFKHLPTGVNELYSIVLMKLMSICTIKLTLAVLAQGCAMQ